MADARGREVPRAQVLEEYAAWLGYPAVWKPIEERWASQARRTAQRRSTAAYWARHVLLVAVIIGLAALLSACTPAEGGRCNTVGEQVTTKDGTVLLCGTDTDNGERLPHWHKR